METPQIEPAQPVLIYDGDCSFCKQWVTHWQRLTGDNVRYVPFQDVEHEYPQITHEQFERGVQLVMPDGTIYSNAEAVFRLLRGTPKRGWMAWAYAHVPLFAPVSEWVYRRIANHRDFAYHATQILWGNLGPHSYSLTRWLFLRTLALVYLIAFASFGVQALGLVGSNGILPIESYLDRVVANLGEPQRYIFYPTLSWLNASDEFLLFLCWGGAALAILLLLDMLATPVLILLYVFYLSLVTNGQTFMSFQWDGLLLETGFLAIFLGSTRWLPGFKGRRAPSLLVIFLFRWLLFRLMLSSGLVKLLSEDPTWHGLTALNYHYWTQPIPNVIAWYMAQLPEWFQKFSTLFTFFVELIVPFLFFAPRRLRFVGGFFTVLLQLLIIVTGNYTYFNWLTIALCIFLFDDDFFRRFTPRRLADAIINTSVWTRPRLWQRIGLLLLAFIVFFASLTRFFPLIAATASYTIPEAQAWSLTSGLPQPVRDALQAAQDGWRIAGNYGLFASMTTTRPEIIVEGSNDGQTWLAYTFPYKPDEIEDIPPFVAPHQPRLDWQMWFAALGGNYRNAPWFVSFARRLLEGSPDVLALLDHNPFPDTPPRFIRATQYQYRFTDLQTRNLIGAWWQRASPREFLPAVSLENFE